MHGNVVTHRFFHPRREADYIAYRWLSSVYEPSKCPTKSHENPSQRSTPATVRRIEGPPCDHNKGHLSELDVHDRWLGRITQIRLDAQRPLAEIAQRPLRPSNRLFSCRRLILGIVWRCTSRAQKPHGRGRTQCHRRQNMICALGNEQVVKNPCQNRPQTLIHRHLERRFFELFSKFPTDSKHIFSSPRCLLANRLSKFY